MANKTLVVILEELATELYGKGVTIHERLQQSLEMYPAEIARLDGKADGLIAASTHIRERIATYKAIGIGDLVYIHSGPLAGCNGRVREISNSGALYALDIVSGWSEGASAGAYVNEVRKVL